MATVEHLCVHTMTDSRKHERPKAVPWRKLVALSTFLNTPWMDIGCVEDQVHYLRISLKRSFPWITDGLSAGDFQPCVGTKNQCRYHSHRPMNHVFSPIPFTAPHPIYLRYTLTVPSYTCLVSQAFFSFLLVLKIKFCIHFSSLPCMWPAV